jgi:hypothetical protein
VWEREGADPENIEFRFVLRNNEMPLWETPVAVNFGAAQRHRSILRLGGIVIQQPDALLVEFRHNDALIASYTIHVAAPAAAGRRV